MRTGASRRNLRAVTGAVVLFLAPNALGWCASVSSEALRRFSAWWPPADLDPLPLAVAGMVVVVVAYLLAQRATGRRQGPAAGAGGGRRLLPPLELVLLQIGNLTFLAFAAILSLLCLAFLTFLLRVLVDSPFLLAHHLTASLGLATVVTSLALRPGAARGGSQDRMAAARLKWPVLSAVAVAGFGVVGTMGGLGPLRIRLEESQLHPRTLLMLYLAVVVCLFGSWLLVSVGGRAASGGRPRRSFAASGWTLALAWIASVGAYTLFLDGAFLTLRAHLERI